MKTGRAVVCISFSAFSRLSGRIGIDGRTGPDTKYAMRALKRFRFAPGLARCAVVLSLAIAHCYVHPNIGRRCDDTARDIRNVCYVTAASDFFARQALINDPANENQANANNNALSTALLACLAYEDILCN